MNNKTSVHSGHRARVREKIVQSGSFSNMLDHEFLEFLLFQSIPRGDTNPLAHKLLDTFGSLNKVLEASYLELMQVEGVGEATALHIASYLEATKRYLKGAAEKNKKFDDTMYICEYFQALCMGNKNEHAYAAFLNKSKGLIKTEKLSEGTIDSTGFYVEKVAELALFHKAAYVIVAHNHTSGNVKPSPSDVLNAELLMSALLDIRKSLLDFVIVDHLDAYSFVDNGIIKDRHVISIFADKNAPRLK